MDQDDSESVFQTTVRFFEEEGWKFTKDEEEHFLRMGVRGRNGNYTCYAKIRGDGPLLLFYCILPVNIPEDKRQEAAEFIARANYGLSLGNFELDFSDGEVRYKTSIATNGGRLTTQMVGVMVHNNIATTDRYFPGLMSVLWSDTRPEEAVAKVEGKEE